jgi:hypothetical protein
MLREQAVGSNNHKKGVKYMKVMKKNIIKLRQVAIKNGNKIERNRETDEFGELLVVLLSMTHFLLILQLKYMF